MTSRDDIVGRLDPQARESIERGSQVPSTLVADRAEQTLAQPPRTFGTAPRPSTLVADRAETQVADPIRSQAVSKLTVLGLTYAPQMDQRLARIVAERLHDWTGGDPELALLVEADFGEAVRRSASDHWTRETSFVERLWDEASSVIEEVRGGDWQRQQATELAERDRIAEVSGDDATVARIMEMSPWRRAAYVNGFDPEMLGTNPVLELIGFVTSPGGGALGGVVGTIKRRIRVEGVRQAELLIEANRRDSVLRSRLEAQAAARATPEMAMAAIARQLVAEGHAGNLSEASALSFDLFGQLDQGEQTKLLTDIRTSTTDEVVEAFEASVTETDPMERVVGDLLDETLDVMMTWDAAAHTIGVSLIDQFLQNFGVDTGETPLEAFANEGWDAFKTSFEEMKQGGIAGFYGIDPQSSAGGWINLGGAILFDPTTWITGGGSAAAKRSIRYMATKQGVDAFLSGGRGSMITKAVAGTDNVLELAPFLHGMSGATRRQLVNASDPAVVADLIRREATEGFWMANGPALGMRQQAFAGAERLGRALGDVTARVPGGGRVGEWITEILARQDYTRSINLGEASFLDEATELVIARHGADAATARTVLDDLYRIFDDVESGGDALAAQRVLEAQELRKQSAQLAKSQTSPVRSIPKARAGLAEAASRQQDLDTWAAELSRELDQVGTEGSRTLDEVMADIGAADELQRGLTDKVEMLTGHVDSFGARYDEVAAQRKDLLTRASRLRHANEVAARPGSRSDLAKWVDEFMESWADDIGVPRTEAGKVNWAEVRQFTSRGQTPSSRLDPFGEKAGDVEALGLLQSGTEHWLKVSPYEMAIYKGAKEAGALGALRSAQAKAAKRGVGRLVATVNGIWAAGLLFNPLNAVKAHVEDIIKFRTAGAPIRTAARALVPIGRGEATGGSTGAFVRQHLAGLAERKGVWETVEHGGKGHFEAAKRWLEGSALNDDAIRHWARAQAEGDPSIFHRWFDEVGQYQVRATAVPIPGTGGKMRTLDANGAFAVIDEAIGLLADASTDPAAFRRLLTETAASGSREVPNKLARIMGSVPVERTTAKRGVLGAGFDVMYGAPARARGGVMYDHYHDTAMGIFEQRFAGRIADDMLDDMVRLGFADSTVEAEWLLTVRSPHLDDWMRQNGIVTRARMEREAAKWASKHAQSLMYLGGASTLAGQAFAKAAPFAPAQFDFLRFWTNQMMAGTDIAMNRPTAAVVGALGKAAGGADTAVGRGLQRAADGSIVVKGVNARLASRWSHLAAESARGAEGDGELGALHPIGLIDRFTFLPVDFTDPENFLVDFIPGLGPIPTWLIHMLPEDDRFREAMESVFPSLEWITGRSDLSPETVARYLLPTTTRSLTGQVGWMTRGVASTGDNWFATQAESMMASEMAQPLFDWERQPIGFTDTLKHHIGDALAANPDLIVGTESYEQVRDELVAMATDDANSAEFGQRIRSYAGLQTRFGTDANSIQHYAGMIGMIDLLRGELGDAQADQLADWWEQIESGDASEKVKGLFASAAASALHNGVTDETRDMLIARNPGLAVNMVGSVQCSVDQSGGFNAPDGYCRPDGRIDTSNPALQGENGARNRQRGFEEGWFEPRPATEIFDDVTFAYNSARGNHARFLWELISGRDYSKGMTKALDGSVFRLNDWAVDQLTSVGIDVDSQPIRGDELRDMFRTAFSNWPQRDISVSDLPVLQEMAKRPEYDDLLTNWRATETAFRDQDPPITSPWEWPDETKAMAREAFAEAIPTDPNLLADYNRWLRPMLGDLEWEPPTPPPVDELENRFRAKPDDVMVEDGDTFRMFTRDGDVRIRIIGLNAPEQGQAGYQEASDQLAEILSGASEIVVGQYLPEKFGAVQQTDENAVRLYAWLYVDGVPLYDPASFTATNQRGVATGGDLADLAELLRSNREGSE